VEVKSKMRGSRRKIKRKEWLRICDSEDRVE
jgi:hypothetical protein